MRKLTILVDMDDTIEELLAEWLHTLNKTYNRYVTPDDIRCWDIEKAYTGLSAEQVYAPLFTNELWENVKPKWDAVEYLRKLQKDGHEIYITTSSNLQTIFAKYNAILARYFPFIGMDHVIVCSKKQMIRGDVMVDDGVHNLEGGDYLRILITAPHNRFYDAEANGMCRVSNWKEAYAVIAEHKKSVSQADTDE